MKNIIFNKRGSAVKSFFRDLIESPDTLAIDVNVPCKNKLLDLIRMVHTSQTIRKKVNLPFQDIWFSMKEIRAFADEVSNFIFVSEALAFINIDVLKKIKREYPKSRFIVIVFDSIHADVRNLVVGRPLILGFPWDLALSFNQDDCDEFGFRNLELKYYSVPEIFRNREKSEVHSDISYIGGAQPNDTRVAKIREIYRYLVGRQVSCSFVITNWPDQKDGIRYEKDYIPYEEFVRIENESNCILEVVKEGQRSNTARYFEAVLLNKKLLTNNPNIKTLPFYDERYMRYFETVYDIDPQWVRAAEPVDYHYNGEFSPVHIPALIDKYLAEEGDRSRKQSLPE